MALCNVFRMRQCILCLLLETGPPFYSVIQALQRSSHSCSAISKTDFFAFPQNNEGWQMVKSETHRDAEILVRNPSPRLFGKTFRDSKKVKTHHAKTRLRDLSETPLRFQDPAKIFWDPRFSRYLFATPTMLINLSQKGSFLVHYPC